MKNHQPPGPPPPLVAYMDFVWVFAHAALELGRGDRFRKLRPGVEGGWVGRTMDFQIMTAVVVPKVSTLHASQSPALSLSLSLSPKHYPPEGRPPPGARAVSGQFVWASISC